MWGSHVGEMRRNQQLRVRRGQCKEDEPEPTKPLEGHSSRKGWELAVTDQSRGNEIIDYGFNSELGGHG